MSDIKLSFKGELQFLSKDPTCVAWLKQCEDIINARIPDLSGQIRGLLMEDCIYIGDDEDEGNKSKSKFRGD